jgi:transcription elongation factor SPT5
MAVPNFMSQTFDDSEEEDDDFAPQPIAASDDDDQGVEDEEEAPTKPSRSSSAPRVRPTDDSEGEGKVNGGDTSKERRNGRTRDEAAENSDEEVDGDNGEDDEGEGEDLNGGLDNEDEDEDEDEDDDEEAVTVGHHMCYVQRKLPDSFSRDGHGSEEGKAE